MSKLSVQVGARVSKSSVRVLDLVTFFLDLVTFSLDLVTFPLDLVTFSFALVTFPLDLKATGTKRTNDLLLRLGWVTSSFFSKSRR